MFQKEDGWVSRFRYKNIDFFYVKYKVIKNLKKSVDNRPLIPCDKIIVGRYCPKSFREEESYRVYPLTPFFSDDELYYG